MFQTARRKPRRPTRLRSLSREEWPGRSPYSRSYNEIRRGEESFKSAKVRQETKERHAGSLTGRTRFRRIINRDDVLASRENLDEIREEALFRSVSPSLSFSFFSPSFPISKKGSLRKLCFVSDSFIRVFFISMKKKTRKKIIF